MRRATLDQQAKAGLQSSSNQHNMQWNMQQQSTPMTQCSESSWEHADASTAGATAVKSSADWQSKAASMPARPKVPTLQPAGSSADASGAAVAAAAVLDLSTPGRTGSGNWVKPHRVQPGSALVNGRIGLDLSVHDSLTACPPWSKVLTTNQVQQQQFSLLTEGGVDAAAHASAASAVVKGISGRLSPARERLHRQVALGQLQSSQQQSFALEAVALQHAMLAGGADHIDDPQAGSPLTADIAAATDILLQPPATAAAQIPISSSAPMERDTNEVTAVGDLAPAAPPFAPRHKRQLAKGTDTAHNVLLQQQDLGAGWWGAGVDSEAIDRQDDSDDILSREMPNLKKLRTRVQGLRVDSSDNLAELSSPAATDNTGSLIPTHPYNSPRMDQTTKTFPTLDCGSAKGSPSGVRQPQKQCSLSRFAPAAATAIAAPHDPGSAAAAGYGNQSQQQRQQATVVDQDGSNEAAMADDDVAMHNAASQSAETAGLTAHSDEQWLKHHRELQQLKQQQEALRALLQQAEQQVRAPITKDAEDLSTGEHGKVTPPAAQVPAGAHAESPSEGSQGGRTAESDAERVAAQMLAQEEGDWERAMQRMLNLVHSTMQHTNSANISCSNDRVAQLKRGSSGSASPLRRSASPAPAKQPSSPYAAVQNASPYFGTNTAAAAAQQQPMVVVVAGRSSPYPAAGPLSAVKLAWPMVPTSAVGSPVGSPAACSPMVPSSAVGSPVIAPAAAAAGDELAAAAAGGGGGGSGMILPKSGWDNAADLAVAAAARCHSPVHSQHGTVPDGCSPSGTPSAAAAAVGTRSRSPVCGSHRRVRHSTRQQSRMAPTQQRTSVTAVAGDLRGTRAAAGAAAAILSITSAGPGTYSAAKAAAASAAAAAGRYGAGAGSTQLCSSAADAAAAALSVDVAPNQSLDFAVAGGLGLSVSAAGPGAYPDAAATATDVAYSRSSAFVIDAAAAAGVAPSVRVSAAPAGPDSQDTTAAATAAAAAAAAAAAVPTLADVLGIGMTLASERQQGYGHYDGAPSAAADDTVSSQHLQQQYHAQVGLAAAPGPFAAHSGVSAALEEAQHHQQQRQQAVDTTAAAAAAAFSNVPALSVDAVLDDAAGWLFGENGLLPDTPGPNNLMARPGQAGAGDVYAQQQQQQLEASAQAQMYSGNAPQGATTAAATLMPDHSNSAAAHARCDHLEQQQLMMPAAAATAAAGLQPISQQEQQPAQQQCFPTVMHGVEAAAAASQGSQPIADTAVASTAAYSMHTAADSWHYDAPAAAAVTWQHHCATAAAAAPSYSGGDVAVAMQHYQQQQQLGSRLQRDEVTAPAAAAATAVGDSQGSQELGTDKDDIALLQVLLGWASDEV